MSNMGISLVMSFVNRVSGPAAQVSTSVGRISKSLATASKQATNAAKSMRDLEASYGKMQKRLEVSQRLSFVGMEMSRLGRGMTAPLKNAALTAMEFEARMDAVGAVTQGTTAQMAALTKQARELGSSTHFSATQAAEGMKFLGMAGFETNEIIASMPGLLAAAKAGEMDLARTSDIASNILSGFGLEASEMGRVADVLVATFTSANASTEQLGETMKYVAPLAREAGMSLEEAGAMAGLLGDAGIQGSMAGTTLRGMLAKLSNPAGDASEMLAEFGIELLDMEGNLRSPITVLGELAGAMENMGSGDRLAALGTIFDDRAASGMAKLMSDEGSGGITKFVKALEQSGGAAARVAAEMGANTQGGLIALSSAVEGLSITFGDTLLPVINVVTRALTGLSRWMTGAMESNNWLAKGVAILVAAVGGLILVLGTVFSTLSGLMGSWAATAYALDYIRAKGLLANFSLKTLGASALSTARKFLFFAGTLIKNAAVAVFGFATTAVPAAITGLGAMAVAAWAAMVPFLPIIAIVAAVAGAAFLIVKYWGPIKGFFAKLWGGVKSGAVKLWDVIKMVFGFSPLGMIMKNWDPIVGYFKGLWGKVGGFVEKITSPLRAVKDGAKGLWNKITGAARPAVAGAMSAAAVAAPMSAMAGADGYVPIDETISEARAASNTSTATVNTQISVVQQPGENGEDLATRIDRKIAERERKARSDRNARLYD